MNTLFFWTSKLVWMLLRPDSLLLILLLTALVLRKRKRPRAARWLLMSLSVALFMAALFPVDEWLFYPLETRFQTNPPLPESVDGILCLGGGEDAKRSSLWEQVEFGDSAERLISFLMLAQRYPQAKLVFTGGSGNIFDQSSSGATVAKRLFHDLGLDPSRLILESESRNTYENALYSKALVEPKAGETWILVTTAWHMPRSVGVFRKQDWSVLPYPVDHWTQPGELMRVQFDLFGHLRNLQHGAKEWVGLLAYYVTGKTSALFPQQDPSDDQGM